MNPFSKACLLCCFSICIFLSASADIRLPQLISNSMVLQRDIPLKIWGWADHGEKIQVDFNGRKFNTVTGADGKWLLNLPALKAGGPYTMTLTGKNSIAISDILIGDVWFCSGQSNMVLPMDRVKEKFPDEIPSANYPQIRNFFVPTASDVRAVHDDLPASKWVVTSPATVGPMGAGTYFFAKQLHNKYKVPIGIINSSVGGTPVEAWASADAFAGFEPYASRLEKFKDSATFVRRPPAVPAGPRRTPLPDLGTAGPIPWYDVAYQPKNWHQFWMPGYWDDQGTRNLHGVIWFRKEIEVPASMTGHPAKLFLGRIIDADEAYVNGVKVGNITYQYPPRRYDIPATLLKPGKNIIVVRVTNTGGKGGFVPDKNYSLTDGKEKIDLRGEWTYKVGQVQYPLVPGSGGGFGGGGVNAQNEPSGLYNTMVAPAVNYAVKGFLWYQGETNSGRAADYGRILTALIKDWRNKWNMGELPFIYAQLPNFNEVVYYPAESQWAELREQQLQTLSVPNTAMTVNIELGEWNDIHPLNKKAIGERFALAAEKLAYGENITHMGPIYQSASINGNKITISFNNTGSGLVSHDGEPLSQFAIAGADKRFVWANARIEGNTVVVWNDDITEPLYVRYAWAENPEGANLYNKEGLPASPFRTDKPQPK
jgi:sialate O-acetylesterase